MRRTHAFQSQALSLNSTFLEASLCTPCTHTHTSCERVLMWKHYAIVKCCGGSAHAPKTKNEPVPPLTRKQEQFIPWNDLNSQLVQKNAHKRILLDAFFPASLINSIKTKQKYPKCSKKWLPNSKYLTTFVFFFGYFGLSVVYLENIWGQIYLHYLKKCSFLYRKKSKILILSFF